MSSLVVRPLFGIASWIERAWDLLCAHREELTTNPDLIVLKPRVAAYETLEDAGKLLVLGLFDGDDLVGYSANLIDCNLHYGDLLVCQNDVLFVSPAHRQSRGGLLLIRTTEQEAKLRGAALMLWHAKPGTALEKLMPALGYRVQDIIHSKVI